MTIHLGGDVSKGYADFCATDEEGCVLLEERLDDTAAGHNRLRAVIAELAASEAGDVSFVCGVEATGGMVRRWLGLFQKLREDRDLSVYQLNPNAGHKFIEQQLHHNKTDPLSAQAIAEYLRRGMSADAHPFSGGGPDEGLRTLERTTKKRTKRVAQLKTEFRALSLESTTCRGSTSRSDPSRARKKLHL